MTNETHTPAELTRLAEALGMTREKYPEFFGCARCNILDQFRDRQDCAYCQEEGEQVTRCTLPSPLSDSPHACLWFYYLWIACGMPDIMKTYDVVTRASVFWVGRWSRHTHPTPTVALFRAYEAQNPAWRGEG